MAKSEKYLQGVESELRDIVEKGDAVLNDLNQGRREATEAMKERWSNAKHTMRNTAGRYAEAVTDAGEHAYKRGRKTVARGADYVRDYPLRSVAIVALAAFAIGALLNRRH